MKYVAQTEKATSRFDDMDTIAEVFTVDVGATARAQVMYPYPTTVPMNLAVPPAHMRIVRVNVRVTTATDHQGLAWSERE